MNTQDENYIRHACVVFRKTNEEFGGLSNMAPGFPLFFGETMIRTTEALYQVCRFPQLPDVQKKIIDDPSPMGAKMASKPHRKQTRTDWDEVRTDIMRWCLRVKLAQNWDRFGNLLQSTGDKPIVEDSHKYRFWGAVPDGEFTLRGANVLGQLLMELRDQLRAAPDSLEIVEPLEIPDFLLLGEQIGSVRRVGS